MCLHHAGRLPFGRDNPRCVDISAQKEYSYDYEQGKIVRAAECHVTLTDGIVTAKTLLNTVRYEYDAEGTLTKKVVLPANGTAQTTYFETDKDNNTVVRFEVPAPTEADPNGKRTVTCHSESDSFGRKVFDELQLGTGFVSRQFSYHAGAVTDEHKANAKLKSSATTQLVSQIILSDGTTLSYTYDNEERIASVTETRTENGEPVVTTTLYTYDALGQLLTETVNGRMVNSMEYDNYGNIKKKNGVAYSYDTTWKDLLKQVGEGDNCSISYDFQGNPLSYLGHTLTWEKGRQLKSFDSNTYTYNANGIRTSKTVNGVKHTYTLDGTKILRETWGNNTLVPLYDNEDSVCGILYNDIPYYFIKNLQGDIIAIVDKDAETVARYSYDAWGVPEVKFDSSDCQIATINPFKYRSCYYDEEIEAYYLSNRYYSSHSGRFINCDTPEMVGLSTISDCVKNSNLYIYCLNNPINDSDVVGCISANQIANLFSISTLFALFMPILYASYSKGLFAVGAYATKIVTPIAIKAFWWKPWLAAALIVAAVAIVVGAIAIYFSKRSKKTAKERSKDAPSWLSSAMNAMPPHWGEKAKDYARRLLDEKYGKGNWSTGPDSEYSKIVKYLTRHLGMP